MVRGRAGQCLRGGHGLHGGHGRLEERLGVNVVEADSAKGNSIRDAGELVGVDGRAEFHGVVVASGNGGEVNAFKGLLLGERVEFGREGSLVVPA